MTSKLKEIKFHSFKNPIKTDDVKITGYVKNFDDARAINILIKDKKYYKRNIVKYRKKLRGRTFLTYFFSV